MSTTNSVLGRGAEEIVIPAENKRVSWYNYNTTVRAFTCTSLFEEWRKRAKGNRSFRLHPNIGWGSTCHAEEETTHAYIQFNSPLLRWNGLQRRSRKSQDRLRLSSTFFCSTMRSFCVVRDTPINLRCFFRSARESSKHLSAIGARQPRNRCARKVMWWKVGTPSTSKRFVIWYTYLVLYTGTEIVYRLHWS